MEDPICELGGPETLGLRTYAVVFLPSSNTQELYVSFVQCSGGIPPGIWGSGLIEKISFLVISPRLGGSRVQVHILILLFVS